MTLGNDPQPLTRRQARELAESQAASSTAKESPSVVTGGSTASSALKAGTGSPAARASVEVHSSTKADASTPHAPRLARRARSTDAAAETPSALPRSLGEAAASDPVAELPSEPQGSEPRSVALPETVATERTYTRRELRARTVPATPSQAQVLPPLARPSAVRPSDPAPAPVAIDDSVPIPPVPANHGRPAATPEGDLTPKLFDASSLPGLHPPVGHWSVGSDGTDSTDRAADDRTDAFDRAEPLEESAPFDQIVARGLGSGGIPTTTNALILPSIPNQGSTSGPLADSGEILITGSFDLPRSLGSTGQLPNHFDSSEMDRMHDQFDDDGAPGAAAPVSASRAVSTHASSRNVMTAPKKRLPSLPAVLAITAAVLALGVLALFIGGLVLNIF